MILALAMVFTMVSFAQNAPQGKQLKFNGLHKIVKAPTPKINIKAEPPTTATVETDWAIEGSYYNNGTAYPNTNDIAVAFDGDNVYIKGLVFLCPDAWIQGTISDGVATFANGQECGTYSSYTMYACGSDDGETLGDITFAYDAEAHTFTLTNYYFENTSATEISPVFYSFDLVVYKEIPVPAVPTNVTAEPTATTADIAWVQGGDVEATSWNLRYRPFVDMTNANRFWDFEDEAQLDDFTLVDKDNDGYNWAFISGITTQSGTGCLSSESYNNNSGTALNPDNWLITPKTTLGGTFSFYACGQDADWCDEVFGVYVCEGEYNIDNFVQVGEDITATAAMTKYEFDLSEYEGTGYIAIVHHNVTNMFRLNIDDVEILVPNPTEAEAAEWIVVENVTSPYTIEGLTPETEYEVQVQAVGQATSAWTASTNFTTLAEQVEQGYYLVGTFCNPAWSPSEGEGRIEFVKEDDAYVATNVVLEAGAEFKIITPAEDGGWIWYGGEHADTDEFLVMPQYYNNYTEITLVPNDPKGNFKMEYGPATYKITIKNPSTTGDGIAPKALQEPIVMVMEKTTGIETINVENKAKSGRFNLLGQPVNENYKGIVIENGVKKIQK